MLVKKKKIYIIHSSKDIDIIRIIKEDLISIGFEPWIDRDNIDEKYIYSQNYLEEILMKNIKNSDFILKVISENSKKSKWVNWEYSIAENNAKIIKTILVDGYNYDKLKSLLREYLRKED